MPTQAALDIVNALFAGKKDVSDYVATGMKTTAVDAIDARKAEVGKTILAPEPPEDGLGFRQPSRLGIYYYYDPTPRFLRFSWPCRVGLVSRLG